MMKRPDMRQYFKALIDRHVNGWSARSVTRLPSNVVGVKGDVTDSVIEVVMRDGTVYRWNGGRYAQRKVNGCYAPLMPTTAKDK